MKINQLVKTKIPRRLQAYTGHRGLVRVRAIYKTKEGKTKVWLHGFGGSIEKSYLDEDISSVDASGIYECGRCFWMGLSDDKSAVLQGEDKIPMRVCPACGSLNVIGSSEKIKAEIAVSSRLRGKE